MRIRRWVYGLLPVYFRKTVFEVFVSILCFFAGIPLLLTDAARSDAINSILPTWLVFVWAWALTIGPVFVILGIIVQTKVFISKIPFWKRFESFGLSQLAYVGYLYTFAIVLETNLNSLPAAAIILAFALTCHFRTIELQIEIADFKDDIKA